MNFVVCDILVAVSDMLARFECDKLSSRRDRCILDSSRSGHSA